MTDLYLNSGVLMNSPCQKTSDWSNYHISCPTNHTIYIAKHVIEDVLPSWTSLPSFVASVMLFTLVSNYQLKTKSVIKTTTFWNQPIIITHAMVNMSVLCPNNILKKAETALKKFCNVSLRPILQESIRQSMNCECIQGMYLCWILMYGTCIAHDLVST